MSAPAAAVERNLYFVRHGMRADFGNPSWRETADNPHDTPLSPSGLEQAGDVAAALAGTGIKRVFSSPFLRALETAHPLAVVLDVPLCIEPGLCEWLNPEWFDAQPRWMTADEAAVSFPRVDAGYKPALVPTFPEQSETGDVFARVRRTLDLVLSRHASGNLAFFAHGASLAQGIAGLLGGLEAIDLRTAAITHIAITPAGPRLVSSGSGHLRSKDGELRFH